MYEDSNNGVSSCNLCGRTFHGCNQRFLLRRHILTHTGEKRHSCPYCSYQANQAGNLNRHIRNLHPGQADVNDGSGRISHGMLSSSSRMVTSQINIINASAAATSSLLLPMSIGGIGGGTRRTVAGERESANGLGVARSRPLSSPRSLSPGHSNSSRPSFSSLSTTQHIPRVSLYSQTLSSSSSIENFSNTSSSSTNVTAVVPE
ncbi:hypothetical protein SK128_018442 [Halocaridina rubra]|uniref:C2H2-type domain-containing protein n=1 Tax=Halocaridina rubra TaxID=373956 RepID=A0AAN8XEL1_HALRR